ncbi:MAG: tetratricopeptide repeat protein [Candidatus Eremiobacteraeota bacterium]|nr:tetratricopeptide repeat protein [Candidatus Eremiobacteraeota bacterium]
MKYLNFSTMYKQDSMTRKPLRDMFTPGNMKIRIIAFLIIIAISIFSGCSISKKTSPEPDYRIKVQHRYPTADAFYHQALDFRESGYYERAIELMEDAINEEPGNLEYRLLLARLYSDTGQSEKVEYHVRKLLKQNPGYIPGLDLKLSLLENDRKYDEMEKVAEKILDESDLPGDIRTRALLAKGDVIYFRDKDYKEAEGYYNRAYELSPGNPRVLFSLANVAAIRREYDKNRKILKEIEKIKDSLDRESLVKLYKWLGDAHVFNGKFEMARKQYLKALEIDPDDYDASVRIAHTYLHHLDLENAHKYLGDIPFKHPNKVLVSMVAGRLWRAEGRFYRALDVLEDALEHCNQKGEFQSDLWWTLANIYRMTGRYDSAEKLYRDYVKYEPDSIEGYLGLAACLLAKGDDDRAEKLFEKWGDRLKKFRPHEVFEIYLMKSMIYLEHRKNLAAAEKNLKLFMEHSPPGNFEPYMMMGYLRLLQQRLPEAKKQFEKALKIGRPEYFVHLEIAGICTGSGYPDLAYKHVLAAQKAIDDLIPPVRATMYYRCSRILYCPEKIKQALYFAEKATRIDPELPEAWILLSRLYREVGEKEKAREALNRALELEPGNEQALFEKNHPGEQNPYFFFQE